MLNCVSEQGSLWGVKGCCKVGTRSSACRGEGGYEVRSNCGEPSATEFMNQLDLRLSCVCVNEPAFPFAYLRSTNVNVKFNLLSLFGQKPRPGARLCFSLLHKGCRLHRKRRAFKRKDKETQAKGGHVHEGKGSLSTRNIFLSLMRVWAQALRSSEHASLMRMWAEDAHTRRLHIHVD